MRSSTAVASHVLASLITIFVHAAGLLCLKACFPTRNALKTQNKPESSARHGLTYVLYLLYCIWLYTAATLTTGANHICEFNVQANPCLKTRAPWNHLSDCWNCWNKDYKTKNYPRQSKSQHWYWFHKPNPNLSKHIQPKYCSAPCPPAAEAP